MPAFTVKVVTDWDPQSPLTTTKLNQLYDNTQYCKDLIGSHLHTGTDGSALIPVGPNYLRNPSFEADTSGWTITQYTGGTVARVTATNLDGAASLAFTSTVLANGGGDAVSNEYVPVTEGNSYALAAAIKASVINVSSKIEILWYDQTKALISSSVIYSSSSTPTALTPVGLAATAPATARFMRVKITGGVPATGTAIGTVYFDGLILSKAMQTLTASLGADVVLSSTSTYFDGPSVAQGTSGKWFVSADITLNAAGNVTVKLWDGATVIGSLPPTGTMSGSVNLSGYISNPTGNLRISCSDSTATSSTMKWNASGLGKDSTITAIRIG